MTGGYFVLGVCFACGRSFTFNPHTVPSIPIGTNGLPSDMGGVPPFERQPICSTCVEVANREREANGLDRISVIPGAYDWVEGLP